MTQTERTKQFFATVESGTVFTKRNYTDANFSQVRESRRNNEEAVYFTNWQNVISNPDDYGVERIETFHKVPTSKITTVDVLEMVKNGCSVEEIEKAIYTTTMTVTIRKK